MLSIFIPRILQASRVVCRTWPSPRRTRGSGGQAEPGSLVTPATSLTGLRFCSREFGHGGHHRLAALFSPVTAQKKRQPLDSGTARVAIRPATLRVPRTVYRVFPTWTSASRLQAARVGRRSRDSLRARFSPLTTSDGLAADGFLGLSWASGRLALTLRIPELKELLAGLSPLPQKTGAQVSKNLFWSI